MQSVEIEQSAYGSDAIAYLCAKYDKDGNGKFDLNECAPRPLRTRVPLSLWGCMARPTLRRPTRLRRVRSIVTDLQKQTKAKKAYKGFAIALFVIVVLALVAMFGTSLAANQVLKDTALDTSGKMKAMDGTPVSVDITEAQGDFFDLPRLSPPEMAHLTTVTVFVDMTADASIGKWVEYAAKIATAYKGDDDVAYLKTMTGDTMTVDGAAKTATLKTADGVFPVAAEAPEAGRRLWGFGGVESFGSFAMVMPPF